MAMSKQDILEAINSTIVANGQKGITAESLNLILNEMVESSGEGGSGSGALRILMPADFFGTGEETNFTPEYWESTKGMMEEQMPGIGDALTEVYNKLFAHNAEVYQQIMEKASKNEGVLCIFDASESYHAAYNIMLGSYGIELDSLSVSISDPGYVSVMYTEPADVMMPNHVSILPIYRKDSEGSMTDITALGGWGGAELYPDGTLKLLSSAVSGGNPVLYVPAEGETLPSEALSSNKYLRDNNLLDEVTQIVLRTSSGGTMGGNIRVIASDGINYRLCYVTMDTLDTTPFTMKIGLKYISVDTDGSIIFKDSKELASFKY